MPATADAGVSVPVVWAVDEAHLCNYLLPRDCPRVCFRATSVTTAADREAFLGAGTQPVVAVETGWYERLAGVRLWVYEFNSASFTCVDLNAGYFVSEVPVVARFVRVVRSPSEELLALGIDVRPLPNLQELAAGVAASSLAFSCIRMRNAAPASSVTPNPFIERTSSGRLRLPTAAAHVER